MYDPFEMRVGKSVTTFELPGCAALRLSCQPEGPPAQLHCRKIGLSQGMQVVINSWSQPLSLSNCDCNADMGAAGAAGAAASTAMGVRGTRLQQLPRSTLCCYATTRRARPSLQQHAVVEHNRACWVCSHECIEMWITKQLLVTVSCWCASAHGMCRKRHIQQICSAARRLLHRLQPSCNNLWL